MKKVMNSGLQHQVDRLKSIAHELDQALKHTEIAASHFANEEVPRGCAHTLAVEGHIAVILDELAEIAKFHRSKAVVS